LRVYIINQRKEPLMPCSPRKARLLLKEGKARVVRRVPFTIQLLEATGECKQEVVAGMDTGSKIIGCAALSNGEVVYQSEIQLRCNISKKMEQRKLYRKTRRGRKCRYRKPRWSNRTSLKREGRLAPSIFSKVNSHLREKSFVESILPVSRWKVETASFDIHKISDPEVVDYQNGRQKGYYNVKAFVLHRDSYKCKKCKKKNLKLHVHHIVFKSKGGTDTPDNLITLCEFCHEDLHAGKFDLKGKRSKTKHATEIGIIKSQLKKLWDFEETFGYETKFKREQHLELPKTHINDAISICCEEGEVVVSSNVKYLKRHISSGDYRQTKGKRSEIKIPTGKLFGLRRFDLVKTSKGIGFVKGKRSTGFFNIGKLNGTVISTGINIKKNCIRLNARKTTLIEISTIPHVNG
jgi:5-methylcytosine-specific restriction endonuclease McrA